MLRVTELVDRIHPADLMLWEMNLIKEGICPKDVTDWAASLGTMAHKYVEKKKITPEKNAPDQIKRMLPFLEQFLEEFSPEYEDTEKEVFYLKDTGVYIGHLDLTAKINNQMWILDTKTHMLYKPYEEFKNFSPMLPIQKRKANLQTWLYSLTENGKYSDYKRGALHINQYGYELVEFKRKPLQEEQELAFYLIESDYKKNTF